MLKSCGELRYGDLIIFRGGTFIYIPSSAVVFYLYLVNVSFSKCKILIHTEVKISKATCDFQRTVQAISIFGYEVGH